MKIKLSILNDLLTEVDGVLIDLKSYELSKKHNVDLVDSALHKMIINRKYKEITELEKINENPIARISAKKIMEIKPQTFGEKAVGLTFNPSGNQKVNRAKQLMADALDLLKEAEKEKSESFVNELVDWESNVFRTQAFNKIIDAQMSLVKYITW